MSKLKQVLKKNPPTIVLTSRCDARSLASLASFWITQGEQPRSQSELVRLSLEFLTEIVIKNFKTPSFTTSTNARDYLQLNGILPQNSRNFKTLLKQVQKETLSAEGFTLDSKDVAKARDAMESKSKREKRLDEELSTTLEILKKKPTEDKEVNNEV